MEARKAQAVAARSYVRNEKNEFAARGYDICATPACQVYRGRSSEHEMTDRAVAQTRGVIATWRGQAINAYYTSTCGGFTDHAENAVHVESIPYLTGVAYAPPSTACATPPTTTPPRHSSPAP